MDVWVVIRDLDYEGREIESIWSSEDKAEAEAARLRTDQRTGQFYAEKFPVGQ